MNESGLVIPPLIARPLFHLLHRIDRLSARIPPIRRAVQPVGADEQSVFDRLLDSSLACGSNSLIDYHLPYPKADFLNDVCDWRGYVAHGSPLLDLATLEPARVSRDTSEFGNRFQVFCSPDAIWALWFAVLDRSKAHLTEDGCVRVGRGSSHVKYYHFDLPAESKDAPSFTDGMVYIAHAEDFPEHRRYPLLHWFDAEVEEWGGPGPVTPLAKLPVKPEDFPYMDKVQFYL